MNEKDKIQERAEASTYHFRVYWHHIKNMNQKCSFLYMMMMMLVEYEKFTVLALNTCIDYTKNNWLNIHGLNDINLIKTIGAHFKLR